MSFLQCMECDKVVELQMQLNIALEKIADLKHDLAVSRAATTKARHKSQQLERVIDEQKDRIKEVMKQRDNANKHAHVLRVELNKQKPESIKKQVIEMLEAGIDEREIIKMGYKDSTVRSIRLAVFGAKGSGG